MLFPKIDIHSSPTALLPMLFSERPGLAIARWQFSITRLILPPSNTLPRLCGPFTLGLGGVARGRLC
jgi:hypothetical protein